MENRREQKERNGERVPNPATLDNSVASYDVQGSYGEPVLVTPPAHRGYIYPMIGEAQVQVGESFYSLIASSKMLIA